MAKKTSIIVDQSEISVIKDNGFEFISLSDIAKKFGEPRIVIQNWMRARNTIHFLGVWESINNTDFNRIEFDALLIESGTNAFSMSPTKWVEATKAKGMITKMGRASGGTYAHKDLALGFCYWISPPFQLYLLQEFDRLKTIEANQYKEGLEWNLKRALAKVNYRVHTDAVKTYLIPPRLAETSTENLYYATEADLLNLALFGVTAKQWRETNPDFKGNIRDQASMEQLLVLSNLENLNAEYIKLGMTKTDRLKRLNEVAIHQIGLFLNDNAIKKLSDK